MAVDHVATNMGGDSGASPSQLAAITIDATTKGAVGWWSTWQNKTPTDMTLGGAQPDAEDLTYSHGGGNKYCYGYWNTPTTGSGKVLSVAFSGGGNPTYGALMGVCEFKGNGAAPDQAEHAFTSSSATLVGETTDHLYLAFRKREHYSGVPAAIGSPWVSRASTNFNVQGGRIETRAGSTSSVVVPTGDNSYGFVSLIAVPPAAAGGVNAAAMRRRRDGQY